MHLLLALALSAPGPGAPARTASLERLSLTVTLGEPRVIAVETAVGWRDADPGVIAPVPVYPARLELTIPRRAGATRPAPVLGTI